MLARKLYLHGTLLTDVGVFAYSSDEIYWFKDNDMTVEPQLIAKVKNIQNVIISPDNTFLIVFNTIGGVFKVSIFLKFKPQKFALAGKPNGARIYMQSNKFGVTVDICGNIFGIDFESDLFRKFSCNKAESYYAIFPSVEPNCFLLQGVDGDDNTFMRKYRIYEKDIQMIDSHHFGDITLPDHKTSFKKEEFVYFIECENEKFGLYSYNEISKETKRHFSLATLDELKKIISCYVSLNYSDEYNCFIIARSDKTQLFDINGICIKEVSMKTIDIGFDCFNSPFDAYILNESLYINTVLGVYKEKLT